MAEKVLPPARALVEVVIDHDLDWAKRGESFQHLRIVFLEHVLHRPVMRSEVTTVPVDERTPVLDRAVESDAVVERAGRQFETSDRARVNFEDALGDLELALGQPLSNGESR